MGDSPAIADPWALLRTFTTARIGLQRAGNAVATGPLLEFQLAHAQARDAVHTVLDPQAIASAVAPLSTIAVRSQAQDRLTYLRRPDLGRTLDGESAKALPAGPYDVVFILADGLSAGAIALHAPEVLRATIAALPDLSIAPAVIASQARVALADEIGERMGAALSVILLGERPGLTTPDSLGIYLTFGPRRGRQDSERNCISNIHARGGLSHAEAVGQLVRLMRAALGEGLSGVGLKVEGVGPVSSVTLQQAPRRLPATRPPSPPVCE
jgi:ethanolamine ammonia-lyase small subunit